MKIQLIFPRHDPESYISRDYGYLVLPTGLEVLASVLERDNIDVNIEILNNYFTSEKEIMGRIDGDIVGVTDWETNHRTAMRLLKAAKDRGAITAVGGPNASNLGPRILNNHNYVDYVFFGSGEYAFSKLVAGREITEIENLWYRKNNKNYFNFYREVDLNSLPLFNFEHVIDFDRKKYKKEVSKRGGGEQVGVSFIRGCVKAVSGGRCSFCSLPLSGLKLMDPQKAWEQISCLHKLYGLDYFQETGDAFNVGNYPEKIFQARPRGLKIKFRGNCTIPIKPNEISTLKKIGFVELLSGLNHVDEKILLSAKINPRKISEIEKTVELLKKNNIIIKLSAMFGLPGETKDSVIALAKYIVKLRIKYDCLIHVNWAQPTVGSDLFNTLNANKKVARTYHDLTGGDLNNDDSINYPELIKLMVKYYCHISYEDISTIVEDITSYKPKIQF